MSASDCDRCDGLGWTFDTDRRATVCQCSTDKARARAESFIPLRYRNCKRETWRGEFPVEAADWKAQEGKDPWALILLGPPGVGKTHIATAIFYRFVYDDAHVERKPIWATAEQLTRDHLDAISQWGASPVIDNAKNSRLLLLDDVGSDRPIDGLVDILRGVLHERHAWMRPTILTCNADTVDDLSGLLGAAMGSRLMDKTVRINVDGRDKRR